MGKVLAELFRSRPDVDCSVPPCSIERAKVIVEEYQAIIEQNLDLGLITSEKLEEISTNKEIQEKFRSLIAMIRTGGDKAVEARKEIDEFEVDMKTGWMDFYRKFHEDMWKLDLLSD